jgi:hypothetical protein
MASFGDGGLGAENSGGSASPLELLNLGNIMLADQDLPGALAAYQAVLDSGHEGVGSDRGHLPRRPAG